MPLPTNSVRDESEKVLQLYLARCDCEEISPAGRLLFVPDDRDEVHVIYPSVRYSGEEDRLARRDVTRLGIPKPVFVSGTKKAFRISGSRLLRTNVGEFRCCLVYTGFPASKLTRVLMARDMFLQENGRDMDAAFDVMDRYRLEGRPNGLRLNGFRLVEGEAGMKMLDAWIQAGEAGEFQARLLGLRRLVSVAADLRRRQDERWPGEPLFVEDSVLSTCWLESGRGDDARRSFQESVVEWLFEAAGCGERGRRGVQEKIDGVIRAAMETGRTWVRKNGSFGHMDLLRFLSGESERYRGDVVSGFVSKWRKKTSRI